MTRSPTISIPSRSACHKAQPPQSGLRPLCLGALLLVAAACQSKPDGTGEPTARELAREQLEQRIEAGLPSSDEVWLVEVLIQRLEIAAALEWIDPQPDDPRKIQADLLSVVEEARRLGVPESTARVVFAAQFAAADLQKRELHDRPGTRQAPRPDVRFEKALRDQLSAVNSQIIATLIRLGRIPTGNSFLRFARDEFDRREIRKPVRNLSLRPFSSPREVRKAQAIPAG